MYNVYIVLTYIPILSQALNNFAKFVNIVLIYPPIIWISDIRRYPFWELEFLHVCLSQL